MPARAAAATQTNIVAGSPCSRGATWDGSSLNSAAFFVARQQPTVVGDIQMRLPGLAWLSSVLLCGSPKWRSRIAASDEMIRRQVLFSEAARIAQPIWTLAEMRERGHSELIDSRRRSLAAGHWNLDLRETRNKAVRRLFRLARIRGLLSLVGSSFFFHLKIACTPTLLHLATIQ